MKKNTIFSIALITLLGIIAYANSLDGEFIWDDNLLIKDNAYVKSWALAPKIFSENFKAGDETGVMFYRPLQILTYNLDYSLWKLNVKGYHLTNIILHILAALCAWRLAIILFNDLTLALLAASLFVVHPIHTEAVSYISGRTDSLAAIFMLTCFIVYIKLSLSPKSFSLWFVMASSYILALLSKETSLVLPGLLLAYHYVFRKNIRIKPFLLLCALGAAYLTLRFTLLEYGRLSLSPVASSWERIPGFFTAITNYIKLLFLPFSLHMDYGREFFPFSRPQAIIGMVILIFLLVYAFRNKHRTILSFSILWFFVSIIPASNIYPISFYMAEHFLYLPSLGFFFILAKKINDLFKIDRFKLLAVSLSISLLFFYSCLTIEQNNYWKEPIAFYQRTLKYSPDQAKLYYNLGAAYYAKGEKEEAITSFTTATKDNPGYTQAYLNAGKVYESLNKKNEAKKFFKKAVEINPRYADAYLSLAAVYYGEREYAEAITLYKKALQINPGDSRTYYSLGLTYRKISDIKNAVDSLSMAVKINPDFADAYNSLGIIFKDIGQIEPAVRFFLKALEINPELAETHNNLSIIYYAKKQYSLAIKHCDQAIKLGYKIHSGFLKALAPHRYDKI